MENLITYKKTEIVGYVSMVAEMRFTPSGKEVTNVSVGSGVEPYNEFTRLVFWGEAGIVANENLNKKGMAIKVSGREDCKVATLKDNKTPYIGKDGKGRVEKVLNVRKLWIIHSPENYEEIDLSPSGGSGSDNGAEMEDEPDGSESKVKDKK